MVFQCFVIKLWLSETFWAIGRCSLLQLPFYTLWAFLIVSLSQGFRGSPDWFLWRTMAHSFEECFASQMQLKRKKPWGSPAAKLQQDFWTSQRIPVRLHQDLRLYLPSSLSLWIPAVIKAISGWLIWSLAWNVSCVPSNKPPEVQKRRAGKKMHNEGRQVKYAGRERKSFFSEFANQSVLNETTWCLQETTQETIQVLELLHIVM